MEDLPLCRIAALVPDFAVKDLALERTLMIMIINIIVIVFGEGYAQSLIDVYC